VCEYRKLAEAADLTALPGAGRFQGRILSQHRGDRGALHSAAVHRQAALITSGAAQSRTENDGSITDIRCRVGDGHRDDRQRWLCSERNWQFGWLVRTGCRRMWTGMVARAGGPLSSDGERTCLSEGIPPWPRRWAVLAELRLRAAHIGASPGRSTRPGFFESTTSRQRYRLLRKRCRPSTHQ
jgi:hypothetical protein